MNHRSYKRQGKEEIPTIHLGASAGVLERKGVETEKGNINREIKKHNSIVRAVRERIAELAIHLWLSFAWGMGASIGVGICGLLMATFIGGTGLGNSIWQFIPWALPVRLVKNLSPYLQFSADMTTPPPLVSSGWAVHQFFIGMTSVGCYLFIALLGGMVWFSKWEGRKYYE